MTAYPTADHWHRRGTIDGRALRAAWIDWTGSAPDRPMPGHWIGRYVDPDLYHSPAYRAGLDAGWAGAE